MKKILIYTLFLSAILIYSSIFIVLKPIVREVDAFTVSILRVVIPAIASCILLFIFKPLKIDRKDYKMFFMGAIGHLFLYQIFSSYALQYTTASRAGILSNLLPIVIIILSVIFLKEKLTIPKIVVILIGFIGSLLILSGNIKQNDVSNGSLLGDILLILGVISTSVTYIANAVLIKKYNSWTVISIYLIISGLLFTPFLIFRHDFTMISPINWLRISYLGLVGVLLANALFVWVTKYINIMVLSISNYLTAFLSVLWALIIYHENLRILDIVGGVLIIMSVIYLNNLSKMKKEI